MSHLTEKVHWWPTGDPSQPWGVYHKGKKWEVVVIDDPGSPRPRYALLIAGVEQEEFVDWPPTWTQQPETAATRSQRADFEREMNKADDVEPLDDDYDEEVL